MRVFSLDALICVAVAYSKREISLMGQTILEIVNQKVSALRKVEKSFYSWEAQELPYTFCYVELEKMRGKDLSPSEVKNTQKYLEQKISHYLSKPSIFWPYNYEEAFKQLLILAKEISPKGDVPQVSIHFQKWTSTNLEFIIYLARPKSSLSLKTTITDRSFPQSIQLITHFKQEIGSQIATIIEAFSFVIPLKMCKQQPSVNLLHVRQFIVKLLENVVGSFRDYNGGLFEMQKKRFEELANLFSEKIPHFSLFAKDVFYALKPIEAQMYLTDALFEKFFGGISQALSQPISFLSKPNPQVVIFTSQNSDKLAMYIRQVQDFQKEKKNIVHADFKILSNYYLCLLATENILPELIKKLYASTPKVKNHTTLHLTLQEGEIPALCPSHLCKEIRSRTLSKLLFEGLMYMNNQNKAATAGCKKVTISKDKKRYIFILRPNFWSNGEKVTAFHYEKAWKTALLKDLELNPFYTIKNAELISQQKCLAKRLGVKAINQEILQVDLEYEDSTFLEKLTYPIFYPILSKSGFFNGAYCVEEKTSSELLLTKNPYYWDVERVYFDRVKIEFNPIGEKIKQNFNLKKTHWLGAPFNWTPLEDRKEIFHTASTSQVFFIYFNTHFSIFTSVLVRKAFASVVDRQEIIKNIFPQRKPILQAHLENVNSGHFFKKTSSKKALEFFEQGLQSLGLIRKNLPEIELTCSDIEKHKKLAKYLKKTWEKQLKIKIAIKIDPWNQFYKNVERKFFQLAGLFRYLFIDDPIPFLGSFTSRETNFSDWSHPEYNKAFKELKQSTSKEERSRALAEVEHIFSENIPAFPLLRGNYFYQIAPELKNVIFGQDGEVDFRFATFQNRQKKNPESP